MKPGLLRVDPTTLETRWLPLDANGISFSGKRPRHERDFPFRIKRSKTGCKLLADRHVLLDGERDRALGASLTGDEVISCLRPEMPIYLFLAGQPARDAGLEASIAEGDRENDWLVYSDWLQQEGDPMGHALMSFHSFGVGCARPDFLMTERVKVEWRYCFWRSVTVEAETRWSQSILDLQTLMAVVSFPQARLLRRFRANLLAFTHDAQHASRLATALVRFVLPMSIEHVELGPVFLPVTRAELRLRFPYWDGLPICDDSTTWVQRACASLQRRA